MIGALYPGLYAAAAVGFTAPFVVETLPADAIYSRGATLHGRIQSNVSGGGVELHRVQAAQATANTQPAVALTFATAPAIGHGVVVGVLSNYGGGTGFGPTACTDNHGHTYTKALGGGGAIGTESLTVYYVPTLTATGSPFTITIAPAVGSVDFVAVAVEVGGVGGGLAVDGTDGPDVGLSSGPNLISPFVTVADIFAFALFAISATQGSISVTTPDGRSPGWTQELEVLPLGPYMAGEIDSRVVSGWPALTGVSAAWTGTAVGWWVAALVVFKATPGSEPESGLTGYFTWGTDPAALTNVTDPHPIAGPGWVPFAEGLSGLAPNTTYCFRAVGETGLALYFGEVFCFTTLGEQTFEDGGVSHPLTWITLTKKDGTKHPYSEVDLNDPPDYYDGYKRPRVERFLPIARGLSDRDGQVEHMTFGAALSDIRTDRDDPDRPFRGMLADPVNQYLTNRPLEVWFIDDTERRRLGVARLAAVGYVNDYAPIADLKFDVKGGDWLKKKFSRKRRAQQSWQPLITAADFPACPEDTLNQPAPLVYGSLGLGGADAVLGVTITVNPQPVAAPANFDVSLVTGGKTAGVFRYYQVAAFVGGQESDHTPTLMLTTTNTHRTIRLTWDAVPGATSYRIYSSHRSDFLQGALLDVSSSTLAYNDTTVLPNENKEWITGTAWKLMLRQNLQYLVYANLGGGLFSQPGTAYTILAPMPDRREVPATLIQRDIDIAWTAHPGAVDGYRIIRRRSYYSDWDAEYNRQWDVAAGVLTVADDNVVTTPVTTPSGELIATSAAGQAEAIFVGIGSYGSPTPMTVSALLIARHACARVGNIYIPATTEGVDGETATTYAAIPDDQYGVTWFAPDRPGWIYPDKYVDINGRRYTLIFTTVEPLPDKVLVDVDGIETAADGTGTLIRSIVDQRLHFMNNFIAPDTPWASGAYLTAADTTFPHVPGLPVVDEVSHAAVKAQLAARLEGAGDYEGATIIGAAGEFVSAVDALARFQISGDFDQAFNRKGQDTVSCEPIEATPDVPGITDVLSIKEASFSLVDQVTSAFFNILPYVHSRDYTGREKTGWYGNAEARSDDSITNYDQERESPKFELHACRANTPAGAATVADVMARKLARYEDPRRTGTLTMSFEGLNHEPGESVTITHQEGIGADGWVGREVRITRHEVDPTGGFVRLDFYDLTAVLENHEALRRRRAALNSDGRPR